MPHLISVDHYRSSESSGSDCRDLDSLKSIRLTLPALPTSTSLDSVMESAEHLHVVSVLRSSD